MSKIRVGYEGVFIAPITDIGDIPENYHFDFNHKWLANESDTKQIAVRKIKAYPMNLTAEIDFAIGDINNNQQHTHIYCTLIVISQ
jgi:hypothetical protein